MLSQTSQPIATGVSPIRNPIKQRLTDLESFQLPYRVLAKCVGSGRQATVDSECFNAVFDAEG